MTLDRLDRMSPACSDKFIQDFGETFIPLLKAQFAGFSAPDPVDEDDKAIGIADEWWRDIV